MKNIKHLVLGISCLFSFTLISQVNIIPKPNELTVSPNGEQFQITSKTKIVFKDKSLESTANFLNDYLREAYGFELTTSPVANGKNLIILDKATTADKTSGGYALQANKKGIFIQGNDAAGAFYGVQSLIQLLPVQKSTTLNVPSVDIKDAPRFGYRGMMLDVSRHFFSAAYVKRFIDLIALHKMNVFHWHLTDDQGWRVEIKKHPKLMSISAFRDSTIVGHHPGKGKDGIRHGGFYTQNEIKDIVKYAQDRFVEVIPEIEMPGHSQAILAAFPNLGCTGATFKVSETFGVHKEVLCAGNDDVFTFLQEVIDEIVPLFPSKYIHVGADECPKDRWKACAKCQKRIKDLNIKDEHELQSYFIQRMEKHLNSKGKKLIGWDEILEGGLSKTATVMSWRGEKGGIEAAKQKNTVIMTPTTYVYFDYGQVKPEDSLVIGGFLPLEKVYGYEPIPKELTADEGQYILGGQANLWTEYIAYPSKVEYMLFPRMTALSEVLWSKKEQRNYDDFQKRLLTQFQRYDLWKVNYHKAWLKEYKK
jgi:hexosaminidase